MTQTPTILLADAREADHLLGWLRSAYNFYVHDLSEFDPERYRLTSGGCWEPDYLPYWLEHSFCRPLVALADGLPIGFAFIGQPPFPFMTSSCDFHLGEFFILRSHRRAGLGCAVAITVFSQLPGLWELRVLARNTAAAKFWRSVIRLVSTGAPKETSDAQGVQFIFPTRATLTAP